MPGQPRVLTHAPAELTEGRLRRLGEGMGKVVYASEHWVVKRERSPSEILALILMWKMLRRVEGKWLQRPSRQLRLLRVLVQGVVKVAPRGLWFSTHSWEMLKVYSKRDIRGERLAEAKLADTDVVPETVTFPPAQVRVGGWPGWLTVSEATARVEATLDARLRELARAGRFAELESWLDRFLELRCKGWQRGVFSVDAHLKNFGVSRERVVLLDTGGLTDRWEEIAARLKAEDAVAQPHTRLGLGPLLRARPDVAARFDRLWKETVNYEEVRRHWPQSSEGMGR